VSSIDRLLANQVLETLIAAELTTPSRVTPYTADQIEINYLPRVEPAELLDNVKIYIAPRTRSTLVVSRAQQRREHAIQIAVMQQAKPATELFLELLDLVAEIDETLANASEIAAASSITRYGVWTSSSCELYSIEDLEQNGVFRSVLTANYLVHA